MVLSKNKSVIIEYREYPLQGNRLGPSKFDMAQVYGSRVDLMILTFYVPPPAIRQELCDIDIVRSDTGKKSDGGIGPISRLFPFHLKSV